MMIKLDGQNGSAFIFPKENLIALPRKTRGLASKTLPAPNRRCASTHPRVEGKQCAGAHSTAMGLTVTLPRIL
jgi:hypothetical protein